jgi:hypothetical protein
MLSTQRIGGGNLQHEVLKNMQTRKIKLKMAAIIKKFE